MYANRAIYENAPLALVTAEVRLNYEPRIKEESIRDAYAAAIRSEFPVLRNEETQSVILKSDAGEITVNTGLPQIRGTNLGNSITVALNPESLSVSMKGGAYREFDGSFAPVMKMALDALQSVLDETIVTRVGLRYLDEIRPPVPPEDLSGWARWVSPDLLGTTTTFPGSEAIEHRTSTSYRREPEYFVNFSCGTLYGIGVLDPSLPFEQHPGPLSHMFILDVDSSWEPENSVALTSVDIEGCFKKLHGPIGQIFQTSITDQARELFVPQTEVGKTWSSYDLRLREERQHVGGGNALARQHRDTHRSTLDHEIQQLSKLTVTELLDQLAMTFGLSWTDLGRMIGVSVPAIRKWRLNGGASAENFAKLVEICAFLTMLKNANVSDPAGWINIRLVPGYTVTIRRLYGPSTLAALLEYATGGIKPETLLNELEPTWRDNFKTNSEVIRLDDGGSSIVQRVE